MAPDQDVTTEPTPTAPAASDDVPPHRYTAALAQDIELRWQDFWDANRTFEAPNPAGPLADPDADRGQGSEAVRARHVPVPIGGRASTSVTRWGSPAPTSTSATSG